MRGQIRIGRIFGVEIRLHYSWFFIAALITLSLAGHLRSVNAAWPAGVVWTAALVTALAFFAALLAHELSHAAVARARGIPVPAVTLFALGGMAHIGRDAADPRTEFWMGLAGPAASVLIGAAALALASLLGWTYDATPATPGMAMLVWFGWINLILAAFNMVPGFPLDGGRVLRALVWGITGRRDRATRIAAAAGQIVAFGFIVVGVLSFFRGGGFGGLWLAFVGLFLAEAARTAALEVTAAESLRGVRVADVMARDCVAVDGASPVADVVEQLLRTGRRCYFVMDDGRVAGMLTPQEIRAVKRDRWDATPARAAMRPIDRIHKVRAEAPVWEALEIIGSEDVNQLPVLEDGRLQGVISRDQILRVLAARAELTNM